MNGSKYILSSKLDRWPTSEQLYKNWPKDNEFNDLVISKGEKLLIFQSSFGIEVNEGYVCHGHFSTCYSDSELNNILVIPVR